MPVLTTIELFYALLVVVLGYWVFRSLSRSRMVSEIAAEPIPERHEPVEEVLRDFEEAKENAAQTVKMTDAHIEQLQGRAKRLRETISPTPSRSHECTETNCNPKSRASRSG
jgi:hypothetical protein